MAFKFLVKEISGEIFRKYSESVDFLYYKEISDLVLCMRNIASKKKFV